MTANSKKLCCPPINQNSLLIGAIMIAVIALYMIIGIKGNSILSFSSSNKDVIWNASNGTLLESIPNAQSKVTAKTSRELDQLFARHEFVLDNVRAGHGEVPRLYLAKLPKDLGQNGPAPRQRQLFVKSLLPMILQVNEAIMQKRHILLNLRGRIAKGGKISSSERTWLHQLAQEYRVPSINLTRLVSRVDVIPPSLALAQAAVETGWGLSYAGKHKNSPFGHMAGNKVKTFEDLYTAVKAYVHNLNSNNAYRDLHAARDRLRRQNQYPTGHHLAEGLKKYSIEGQTYISKVQKTIKQHKFHELDRAQLSESQAS